MKTFHRHRVLFTGLALLGILNGVCVLAGDITEDKAAGDSLTLTVKQPKDKNVTFAQWKFNGLEIANYDGKINYNYTEGLFNGRINEDDNKLSITIKNLQLQDSGTFIITAETSGLQQLPTQTIRLTVHTTIEGVQIQEHQTWQSLTNSCDVQLHCQTLRDHSVSYSWTGHQSGREAWLNFTLSPAEGDITLTCTVFKGSFNKTATKTLRCTPEQPHNDNQLSVYIWIAIGGGVGVVLLFAIIAVSCWWRSIKNERSANQCSTVYADVNPDLMCKDKRSQSIVNGTSIYETVDDLRVISDKPQTLYDKVNFARPAPPTPLPYNNVL